MKKLSWLLIGVGLSVNLVHAENIKNPVAVFAGLDKIMGITKNFEEKVGEDVKFSNLIIKAEVCNTAPIT